MATDAQPPGVAINPNQSGERHAAVRELDHAVQGCSSVEVGGAACLQDSVRTGVEMRVADAERDQHKGPAFQNFSSSTTLS